MYSVIKEESRHGFFYSALIIVSIVVILVTFMVKANTPVTSLDKDLITSHHDNSTKIIDPGELSQLIESLQKRLVRIEDNQRILTREFGLSRQQKKRERVHTNLDESTENNYDSNSWGQESADEILDDINMQKEKLEQEAVDANWASEIEVTIGLMLDDNKISDMVIDQIDCRETLCQFEFIHFSEAGIERFFNSIHTHEAFSGEVSLQTVVDEYGEEKVQVLLSRSHESLDALTEE